MCEWISRCIERGLHYPKVTHILLIIDGKAGEYKYMFT